MPGFLKRKVMDRVAQNLNDAYFAEANRSYQLSGRPADVAGVDHLHHVCWGRAMETVFRSRSDYDRRGNPHLGPVQEQVKAAHLEALLMANGFTADDWMRWRRERDASEYREFAYKTRRLWEQLEAAADADRDELRNQVRSHLRSCQHFGIEEVADIRMRFEQRHGAV